MTQPHLYNLKNSFLYKFHDFSHPLVDFVMILTFTHLFHLSFLPLQKNASKVIILQLHKKQIEVRFWNSSLKEPGRHPLRILPPSFNEIDQKVSLKGVLS